IGVGRAADQDGVAILEIVLQVAVADDLGRADEGEVLRPEEDDLPLAVRLGEVERLACGQLAALLDGNGDGGEFVTDGEHVQSPMGWVNLLCSAASRVLALIIQAIYSDHIDWKFRSL